ncbi:MAG: GNAT family N-acetyltransferase [Firmicutes bacterium]|nr:GNAT family N-acetyltransferase [Bacillota bacterium]
MKLKGEKISLRPIQESDFEDLVAWSNDSEINSYSEGDYPLTLSECHQWLKRSKSNRYQERFAIELNKELIGDIELDHITWRSGDAELRIRIGKKVLWDKGYGTDSVRTLLAFAFLNLNLSRVYLRVYADNHRAIRCYEKVGFKKEGRLRRSTENNEGFREILLMRILKDEFLRRNDRIKKAS